MSRQSVGSYQSAWNLQRGGSAVVVAAVIVGGALAGPSYQGTLLPYLAFQAASLFLAAAVVLRPVSYGFTVLAIFLLLGFWLKLILATLGVDVLIEPVGGFTGSAEAWDRAALFGAAGLTGVALGGLTGALVGGRGGLQAPADHSVPDWYRAGRRTVWVVTGVTVAVLTWANWTMRFYVVGVHEEVILPFPLNAALAWWYTVAVGIWIAVLLEWERRVNDRKRFWPWLLIPVLEALMTTVVMLSRGFYIMKTLPYALALARPATRRALGLSSSSASVLVLIALVGFVASLAAVSWLRITIYPRAIPPASTVVGAQAVPPAIPPTSSAAGAKAPVTPSPEGPLIGSPAVPERPPSVPSDPAGGTHVAAEPPRISMSTEMRAMGRELSRMVVGRWIGLEGVLAVATYPDRDQHLFVTALVEDPRAGNAALYQRMAHSAYDVQEGFTFLTVPGFVAVLSYSGSHFVLLVGGLLVAMMVVGTESAFRRVFQNDFLCAVTGVAMANAVAQMNFPYLTVVFFIEMWVTLAFLALLELLGKLWFARRERAIEA